MINENFSWWQFETVKARFIFPEFEIVIVFFLIRFYPEYKTSKV